jgi:hypothetical protein
MPSRDHNLQLLPLRAFPSKLAVGTIHADCANNFRREILNTAPPCNAPVPRNPTFRRHSGQLPSCDRPESAIKLLVSQFAGVTAASI